MKSIFVWFVGERIPTVKLDCDKSIDNACMDNFGVEESFFVVCCPYTSIDKVETRLSRLSRFELEREL